MIVKTESTAADSVWVSFIEGYHRHTPILFCMTCSYFKFANNEITGGNLTMKHFKQQRFHISKRPTKRQCNTLKRYYRATQLSSRHVDDNFQSASVLFNWNLRDKYWCLWTHGIFAIAQSMDLKWQNQLSRENILAKATLSCNAWNHEMFQQTLT